MGFDKIKQIVYTLSNLKLKQVYYQFYYRVKHKLTLKKAPNTYKTSHHIQFNNVLIEKDKYLNQNEFSLLNKNKKFDAIDWNFSGFGKLWTYNLNYFDFLNQASMTKEAGLTLINDFCSKKNTIQDGYEPYPISLRVMNWVKFLSKHAVEDKSIDQQLYADLYRLNGKIEYHILANHLFENGFGLLFGAYYFKDEKLYKSAFKIISTELKEQILPDGGHYELTPMYHQIILHRILDSIQLISKNDWKGNILLNELKSAAREMLGWMNAVNFKGYIVPKVNDTTQNISALPQDLLNYANKLDIQASTKILKESGYRKMEKNSLEVLFDVGQISPSYQPGHSHADNLQILVNKNGLEVLVDTGISTYEKNERRLLERSTISHNTVSVNNNNSSDVWSGFRIGRRAKTILKEDSAYLLKAEHNGYGSKNTTVCRTLENKEQGIQVTDEVKCSNKKDILVGHLHFHPSHSVTLSNQEIYIDGELFIAFNSPCILKLSKYKHCVSFNSTIDATKATYTFEEKCSFTLI